MNKIQETSEELEILTPLENSHGGKPNENENQTLQKKKRELSPLQKETLTKGRQKALQKRLELSAKKKLEEQEIENEIQRRVEEYRKQIEDRIVKKAVSIKKKEIKKHAILDEISDDDTPIEKVKEIIKKGPKKVFPSHDDVPKFIFV